MAADPFITQWKPLSRKAIEAVKNPLIIVASPSGRVRSGRIHQVYETYVVLENGSSRETIGFAQRGLKFLDLPAPEGFKFGNDLQRPLPL